MATISQTTFYMHFLDKNVSILINISLKSVPKGQIDNIPALVQIMAWRRLCANSLSDSMVVSLLTHICVTRSQWVNSRLLISFQYLGQVYLSFPHCHFDPFSIVRHKAQVITSLLITGRIIVDIVICTIYIYIIDICYVPDAHHHPERAYIYKR